MEDILPRLEAGTCIACSDFPTPHLPTLIFSSLTAWGNDRIQFFLRWRWFVLFARGVHRADIFLTSMMLRGLHKLAGGKVLTDPNKAKTQRAEMMWHEALRRGISMEQIILLGTPVDCYRVRWNDTWIYFEGLPIPPRRAARSYEWIDDKMLFKQFLQQHGFPVASASVHMTLKAARETFLAFDRPVVVKPRIGSRARHTTPSVRTKEQFEAAFRSARQLCRYVMFEEHLSGPLCRATVVDGTLVGFLKKTQPSVTGDGQSTIHELIAEKNTRKPKRVWDIVLGPDHESYLDRQGYRFDSVLEKGKTIEISRHSGRQVGGESHEMPQNIHPKLRACVEKVARLLQSPLVGLDLIIPDPTADPDAQTWGILEANPVPFIELHYSPLYGQPSNIAAAIWDLWEKEIPAGAGSSQETSLRSLSNVSG